MVYVSLNGVVFIAYALVGPVVSSNVDCDNSDLDVDSVVKGSFGGLKGLNKTVTTEVGQLIGGGKKPSNESADEAQKLSTSAFDVKKRVANVKYAEEILESRKFKFLNENCFDAFLTNEQEYAGYTY